MSRTLAAALSKLLTTEKGMASSNFSSAQQLALQDFARKTQAIRLVPQGRGSQYQILNQQVVQSHLNQLSPITDRDILKELPQRAVNVARYRDSKGAASGHGRGYLLLKCIGNEAIWRNEAKHAVVNLKSATALCGAAALSIKATDGWCSDTPLWLVENQALFDDLRWLPPESSGTICYYAGNINGVMLDWLGYSPRAPKIILFPDYDGIGLKNFVRIRERVGAGAEFWLMNNWEELLHRHGNQQIWIDNFSNFIDAVTRLNALEDIPLALMTLCSAMQNAGLALEQEAVFLDKNRRSL